MNLYRVKIFNFSKIQEKHGYYIDSHEDNYFPDDDENISFVRCHIIDDDIMYIFIKSDEYKINKLINLLNGRINFKIDNVTDQFIKSDYIEGINIINNKKFFNDFRLNYMSIDDVLDKINEYGFNKLDDIDICILKNGD